MQSSPNTGILTRSRLIRTITVLIAVLGSSFAAYEGLIIALGVGQPIMIVVSDSMEPTIGLGDFIAVRTIGLSNISLGNVIVYEKSLSNIRIVHRVICIVTSSSSQCQSPWYPYLTCYVPPCYYTKGDNNFAPDPWVVLSNEIVAVWTGFRIPYLGMTILCLRQDPACPSPWGITSITSLGAVTVSAVAVDIQISRTHRRHASTEKSTGAGN